MKRALVTGGSGDIGAAICKRLASAGLHVVVHANTGKDRAEAVAAAIRESGGTASIVCFDVADGVATHLALENLLKDSPIQVLVNNAGIHDDAPLAGMPAEQWRRVIDVSLNGFYNVTQPLLLPMMATRWGRIISVSSVAGQVGSRGQTNYAAAKAGLHGASKSLAKELGSRGITVNVVAPGIIAGSMTEDVFSEEQIRLLVPIRRPGKPEEVAEVVNFLASEGASYVSGQVIGVNGAMT